MRQHHVGVWTDSTTSSDNGWVSIEDIRRACDTIESLRPLLAVRTDVVAEETVKSLADIISCAEQMRDDMMLVAYEAGVGIRPLARSAKLSHVTVRARLNKAHDE